MLGKLLKYEMDAVGRRLMPLFAAWAATSVLLGLGVGRLDTEGDLFAILSILLYIAVTTAVFVMFLILIIQRYRNSLLGDEAYFNLTLPVSITEHLANKTLSALIWSVISTLAALVSVVLILLFSSGLKEFLNLNITAFLKQLYAGVTWQAVLIFIEVIVVGLFSIVKSILAIYAAITLGHQAKKRVTLASIGAYIGLLVLETTLGRVFMPLFNIELNEQSAFGTFQYVMLVSLIATLCLSAFYFYICKYLLERKADLN